MKKITFLFCLITSLSFSQNCPTSTGIPPIHCYFDGDVELQEHYFNPLFSSLGCITGTSTDMVIKDTEITINGNLTIKSNVVFDNVIINMTEGSSIQINSIPYGWDASIDAVPDELIAVLVEIVKVDFINGTIIQGCDKMWNGISFSTYKNVSGPNINFDQVTLRDAFTAIKTSARGNFTLNHLDFVDNYIGLNASAYRRLTLKNSNFKGEGLLKPAYGNLNLDTDVAKTGIFSNLREGFTFLRDSEPCTFEKLEFGIEITASNANSPITIVGHSFTDNDICISIEDFRSATISNNNLSYFSKGVFLKNATPGAAIQIGFSGQNMFECASNLGLCFSGVHLQNISDGSRIFINNNSITGPNVLGINLDNINTDLFFMDDNTINDAILGIHTSNTTVNGNNIDLLRGNSISNSASTPMAFGILAHNSIGLNIIDNSITSLSSSSFSQNGLSLNGNSTSNFIGSNTIVMNDAFAGISLAQSMINDLCCNITSGANLELNVLGTNSSTNIRNTVFDDGTTLFRQSSVGVQDHAGNRWQDGSTGELVNTDLATAALDNRFRINPVEANVTDGRVTPENVIPTAIANNWFRTDNFGNSLLCSSPLNANCNLSTVINPNVNPNINPSIILYLPGSCGPEQLDIDNDGVCDNLDPDPLDACIPNGIDLDNDGICDGVDIEPLDGNVPFVRDSDGDGLSDVVDSDILNPIVPIGIDQDNDGVGSNFDPDDFDSTIPITSNNTLVEIKDINNNFYGTSSIIGGIPKRSITEIELLVDKVFGPHEYELVNQWENDFALANFLLHNQYYLSISQKLNDYWTYDLQGSRTMDYLIVYNDILNYQQIENNLRNSLIEKNIYLDRIESMIEYYTVNYNNNHLELLFLHKETLSNQIKVILQNHELSVDAKRIQLRTEISNLASTEVFHATLKEVWLKQLRHDEGTLGSTDMPTLQILASNCPLEYGTSVYSAQSLLLQYDNLDLFNLTDLCSGSNIRDVFSSSTEVEDMLVVYPNPTLNQVKVKSKDQILKVEVYQNGKFVQEMSTNNRYIEVDLSKCINGIVRLKIITSKGATMKQIVKIE